MTFIKNATDLTEKEMIVLKKLYLKYFKEVYMDCRTKHPGLSRIKTKLNARKYTEDVLRQIKSGQATSFVSFDGMKDDSQPNGFITGQNTSIATITHFYVDIKHLGWRRENILELYKRLALKFKRQGSSQIIARSDLQNHILNDYLETLSFDYQRLEGSKVEYGRKL